MYAVAKDPLESSPILMFLNPYPPTFLVAMISVAEDPLEVLRKKRILFLSGSFMAMYVVF